MPQRFTSIISAKEKVSSKVYLATFELVSPSTIEFLAGQTVMFYVAPGVNRSMSVASPPQEKNKILIAHDVSPGGVYSKWTVNAKVGDKIDFMGPLGMFTLDKTSPRNKIFVATGTGVAPFRSMLLDVFQGSGFSPSERLRVKGQISLYWGLRHEEDIFWQKELEEFTKKQSNFKFILTLSKPDEGWTGAVGRVGEHIFSAGDKLIENEYYLCGSRDMVKEVSNELLAKNVPKEQIKFELFY